MSRKRPVRDHEYGEQPQHDVLQMSQDCIDVAWEKSPERVIEFQEEDEIELRLEERVMPMKKKSRIKGRSVRSDNRDKKTKTSRPADKFIAYMDSLEVMNAVEDDFDMNSTTAVANEANSFLTESVSEPSITSDKSIVDDSGGVQSGTVQETANREEEDKGDASNNKGGESHRILGGSTKWEDETPPLDIAEATILLSDAELAKIDRLSSFQNATPPEVISAVAPSTRNMTKDTDFIHSTDNVTRENNLNEDKNQGISDGDVLQRHDSAHDVDPYNSKENTQITSINDGTIVMENNSVEISDAALLQMMEQQEAANGVHKCNNNSNFGDNVNSKSFDAAVKSNTKKDNCEKKSSALTAEEISDADLLRMMEMQTSANTSVPNQLSHVQTQKQVSETVNDVLREESLQAMKSFKVDLPDNIIPDQQPSSSSSFGFDDPISDADLLQLAKLEEQALLQQCLLPFSPEKSTAKPHIQNENSYSSSNGGYSKHHPTSVCERFIALDVLEYVDNREKVIRCFKPDSSRQPLKNEDLGLNLGYVYTVVLVGEWYDTPVATGDVFHIVFLKPTGDKLTDLDISQYVKVTDTEFLFVIHPDTLVTPSTLSESISCSRRGVLNSRSKIRGTSRDAVLGNIKHEFIEKYSDLAVEFIKLLDSFDSTNIEENILSRIKIQEIIEEVKSRHLESMLVVNIGDQEIINILNGLVPKVARWIHDFTSDCLKTCGDKKISGMVRQVVYHKANLQTDYDIDELSGIEENLWCPIMGVKGQVDLVVSARSSNDDSTQNMPIEIKTGKWRPSTSISHRAQTILYIIMLLLRDKQMATFPLLQGTGGVNSTSSNGQKYHPGSKHGVLLYINDDAVRCEIVEPTWAEIRALVICRNRLASDLVHASQVITRPLPSMLKRSDCERCFSAAECMLSHAAIEGGDKRSSGVPLLFSYVNRGLSHVHYDYFKQWNYLIDLENQAMTNFDNCLWTSSADICERAMEKCIGNLYISGHETFPNHSVLIFKKQRSGVTVTNNIDAAVDVDIVSVVDARMSHLLDVGDRVHVSMETNCVKNLHKSEETVDIEDIGSEWSIQNIEPAICVGNIILVTADEVHVSMKKIPRRLRRHFGGANMPSTVESQDAQRFSFRLDKDSTVIGVGTMRSNLLRLFVDSFNPNSYQELKMKVNKELPKADTPVINGSVSTQSPTSSSSMHSKHVPSSSGKNSNYVHPWAEMSPPGVVKIRELVVDLRKPRFNNDESIISKNFLAEQFRGCNADELAQDLSNLNMQQREAAKRIVHARDYVLLLGMPGTGKSSTIAFTIRALVGRGHRVLVTSYTHSAVDSLTIKLKESGMDPSTVLRIGAKTSINKNLQEYVLDTAALGSTELLKKKIEKAKIIACTVLAASSESILSNMEFDYCIVDEAGQITQPAALGALLLSKRFVLVGDDYQLPPLVLSTEAQNNGMDISLFKRLAEAHPDTVVSLSEQYRMNAEIMQISNVLIYDRRLKCGNEKIARGRLQLPRISESSVSRLPSWLRICLDVDQPVLFINTDQLVNPKAPHDQKTLETFQGCKDSTRGNVVNLFEVEIIKRIYDALKTAGGYDMRNLGIVSPYRSQVTAIKDSMKTSKLNLDTSSDVELSPTVDSGNVCEISTVDKFQGRDMEVMILSMVRSNSSQAVGNLLRDWRRVNVAITRAKFKLLIVGSLSMTDNIAVLKALGNLVKTQNCVVDVPADEITLDIGRES